MSRYEMMTQELSPNPYPSLDVGSFFVLLSPFEITKRFTLTMGFQIQTERPIEAKTC